MTRLPSLLLISLVTLGLSACGGASAGSGSPGSELRTDQIPRLRFNQLAVQANVPLFWVADADEDGAIDPDEVRSLRFYPTETEWSADGRFTPAFEDAYEALLRASLEAAPSDERRRLVHEELGNIAPTLIENDLRELPEPHRAFAGHMMRVAELVDALYARQVGMDALAGQVPDDAASRSLFRRNWGPGCLGAATEANPACSAIEGAPPQPVDVYPTAMQQSEGFCQVLEAREDSATLLTPFTVVREREDALVAVPYAEAYADLMGPIATELRAAVDAMTDPAEEALRAYLTSAAQAFEDNDWHAADEGWAAMNARNSGWYVRVGPDETYWDPCSQKAGFHLTFARINQGSLEWQDRLTPMQQRMEASLAALVGDAYTAREVSFHLPDFIDIVANAGDDRDAFGATIGQSLPNWGPVSAESRGRTVAMTNLYTDPDSAARRREVAESMLTAETMALYTNDANPGLLSTILHEATHNLGPSHEYRVNDQTDDEAFGGGLASMLEELKAQSGALFFAGMLAEAGVIEERRQQETYLDSVVWAFGHISRGMYTPSGQRKAYSQLAAVQIGFLMEHGAVRWDPEATAANGTDQGAFTIDFERFPAVVNELMTLVMRIKATGDRAEAERVADLYVDGDAVPQATIVERYRRFPQVSFVYSTTL